MRLNQTFISETDEQRFMHRDEAGGRRGGGRLQNEDRVMEGGHFEVKTKSNDDAFGYFLFSAFLPLIGVPPGEVK